MATPQQPQPEHSARGESVGENATGNRRHSPDERGRKPSDGDELDVDDVVEGAKDLFGADYKGPPIGESEVPAPPG